MSNISEFTNASTLKLQHVMTQPGKARVPVSKSVGDETSSFAELLNQKVANEQIHFSKHATKRVRERGIEMTPSLLNDLNTAVQKAKGKGARDVAIISESGAFIVNIPNNVVITTISETEMKENIFTNIDSAVII